MVGLGKNASWLKPSTHRVQDMSDDPDSSYQFDSWEEVAYSNLVQGDALVSLLLKKGIITKEEMIEELNKVKAALLVPNQE